MLWIRQHPDISKIELDEATLSQSDAKEIRLLGRTNISFLTHRRCQTQNLYTPWIRITSLNDVFAKKKRRSFFCVLFCQYWQQMALFIYHHPHKLHYCMMTSIFISREFRQKLAIMAFRRKLLDVGQIQLLISVFSMNGFKQHESFCPPSYIQRSIECGKSP